MWTTLKLETHNVDTEKVYTVHAFRITEVQMSQKEFLPEELLGLKRNPYVKSATTKTVRFTIAFKEEFWERYKAGQSPASIVQAMGFDPEVLGAPRINGILQHIKDTVASGEAFRDHRRPNLDRTDIEDTSPSKALIRMQHELCYLRQEIEFVKKIITADRKNKLKC